MGEPRFLVISQDLHIKNLDYHQIFSKIIWDPQISSEILENHKSSLSFSIDNSRTPVSWVLCKLIMKALIEQCASVKKKGIKRTRLETLQSHMPGKSMLEFLMQLNKDYHSPEESYGSKSNPMSPKEPLRKPYKPLGYLKEPFRNPQIT